MPVHYSPITPAFRVDSPEELRHPAGSRGSRDPHFRRPGRPSRALDDPGRPAGIAGGGRPAALRRVAWIRRGASAGHRGGHAARPARVAGDPRSAPAGDASDRRARPVTKTGRMSDDGPCFVGRPRHVVLTAHDEPVVALAESESERGGPESGGPESGGSATYCPDPREHGRRCGPGGTTKCPSERVLALLSGRMVWELNASVRRGGRPTTPSSILSIRLA